MDSEDDRGRRLDMNHGFIKSIVMNQIDRDEYHRVMEERKAQVQEKVRQSRRSITRSSRSSLPAEGCAQLYVPPHLRKSQGSKLGKTESNQRNLCPALVSDFEESNFREKVRTRIRARLDDIDDLALPQSSTVEKKEQSIPLFLLSMKNTDGSDVEVPVMSTDNAARLAKQLSRKYGFTEEQSRMLRLTLDKELENRVGK